MCSVLDDKCPAHNLCAYIEELCDYTFTITCFHENTFESREEVYFVVLISILRHFDKPYDDEHSQDNQPDNKVGGNQNCKVAFFDSLKFTIIEQ